MNREVTMELLEKYGKEFVQDRANRVAQNAVVGKGVNAAARRARAPPHVLGRTQAGFDHLAGAFRPLLDVRSLKLHAFSGNEALQSGNF